MKQRPEMVAQFRACFGELCLLPQHRLIEPCSRPRRLRFKATDTPPYVHLPARTVLALNVAYGLLADWQESQDPKLAGLDSWQRYLALPRKTALDKLMAETFRILRVFRLASLHANGVIQLREDGLIRASVVHQRCGLSLLITQAGLELLVSMVSGYLESFDTPYSEAYQVRLWGQYFHDLVEEIRGFADEDRVLYQFRHKGWFNRYLRLNCDNPQLIREGDQYRIEIGKYADDPVRFPIDYYITLDHTLYIVPTEGLHLGGRLPVDELPYWQAHTQADNSLPEAFRVRFAREKNVVGLPMT